MTTPHFPPPQRRLRRGERSLYRPMFAGFLLVFAAGCVADRPDRKPSLQDVLAMLRLVDDSDIVIAQLDADPTFDRASLDEPLSPDERERTLPMFATFIDHDLAFRSYRTLFLDAWRYAKSPDVRMQILAVGMGAHAASMRARLRLMQRIGASTAINSALNEASPEYGISAGHVDRMMVELARPDTIMLLDAAAETLRETKRGLSHKAKKPPKDLNKVWQAAKLKHDYERKGKEPPQKLKDALSDIDQNAVAMEMVNKIEEFSAEVAQHYGRSSGRLLNETIDTMLSNEIQGALSPIITDIALWLGDTRLRSSGSHLISESDLDGILPDLAPGDVILERRNWYLSNLGLPGFWPHAAVYLGTPTELKAYFDADADVLKAYPGGLSAHLEKTYPDAWASFQEVHDDGPMRVIEAISEGVVFTSLYHSCLADYVAFLRPRLTKTEKAHAIAQAFSHWSKPYDFDFDFQTVSTLVCSELVYTSYKLPTSKGNSLNFDPLPEVMGRLTLPPNDIIEGFDATYGTADQQFDFVVFLDGKETSQSAVKGSVEDLRASWKRSKWDLSQQ